MSNIRGFHPFGRTSVAALLIAAFFGATMGTGHAADPRAELLQKFQAAVKGKKVAWVPVWLGVLESEWTRVMKAHFDDYGIQFTFRDPNF
ncbi:MAG: ribose transport system substrate-binding protein, partial [Gammaproteobacteria bacterium]|nr:ribose transport system substrate-binding protein [Gammaproteobacteria bacterium]